MAYRIRCRGLLVCKWNRRVIHTKYDNGAPRIIASEVIDMAYKFEFAAQIGKTLRQKRQSTHDRLPYDVVHQSSENNASNYTKDSNPVLGNENPNRR